MCGIAGTVYLGQHRRSNSVELDRMLDAIAHRGPDGRGIWTDDRVALGHVRLSVLDLTDAAAQPMHSASGRSVITYNGEVYNFVELRDELDGSRLGSSGDTAVVVEYIERFGIARFIERAEGFFALGFWDREALTFTLARDRHGIKPLYIRHDSIGIHFASEMWPLSEGLEPDPIALTSMLAGRSVTTGERTLYRDLRAVKAGEVVVIDASTGHVASSRPIRPSGFYDHEFAASLADADDEALVAAFEAAFRESVRLRMTSDAPVACFASGGIDSSLVAAIAKDEGFDLPLYHADVASQSERSAAELLARHLGSDLVVETTTDDDVIAAIVGVTRANEMPLTYHINAIPFYLLARRVKDDGIKVILTGEGADEYLLGYPQYGMEWAIKLLERFRSPLRQAVRSRTASMADRIWFDPAGSMNSVVVDLLSGMDEHVADDYDLNLSHLVDGERQSLLRSLDLVERHLLSTLHRNDRLGMAWGLECRFPFLGHEVARACLSGPARQRLRWTRTIGDRRHPFVVDKWVIRELARRLLPVELVERPKLGFPVTIWNRTDVRMDALADGPFATMFGLGRVELESMATALNPMMRFRCLLTDVWLRTCVERLPQSDVETFLDKALLRSQA